MKKFMITTMLVAFAMMAQAQIYVGGELGFNTSGSKFVPKTGDVVKAPRTTTFSIAPVAAYQFSEKIAFGARIGFERETETIFKWSSDGDLKDVTTMFGLGVFANYTCLQFGKFSVLTEAGLAILFANGKRKLGSNTDDLWKGTGFGLNITPVLAYDLNEKIRLICQLNFLTFGYNSMSSRWPANSDDKTVGSSFGFNFNSDNVASLNAITIGFLYKF